MRMVLAAALVLLTTSSGRACINDREVESHEREFKSQYRLDAPAPTPEASPVAQPPLPMAAGGTGLLMLMGAAVVSARTWRAGS